MKSDSRRFAVVSSDLHELYRFKDLAVKGLILESSPDGDMPLLFHATSLLPLDSECSLTFKSLCFSDSDISQVLLMLTQIRSIPLLKVVSPIWRILRPSADVSSFSSRSVYSPLTLWRGSSYSPI